MFEHMKNYEALLAKVSSWMRPSVQEGPGRAGAEAHKDEDPSLLFIHIFCHRDTPYHFEEGDGWMAKNFFSGGTMPSHDLFVSRIPLCSPPSLTSLPAILPNAYHARTQLVPAWHALRAHARGLVEFAGFQEARCDTKLTQGIITDGFIQRV